MDGGSSDPPRSLPSVASDADAALLQQELDHARAEVQLKDEYIAFLHQNLPSLERALAHQVAQERRVAQRREMVRRIPGVGSALAAARRAGRRINGS